MRADLPVPKRTGDMSKLSKTIGFAARSFSGSFTPATAAKVAIRSRPPTMLWSLEEGSIFPGIQAMAGTRLPPSRTVPLVPRNGV
ncbi:hypothetical protein D3C87_1792300 [compost metagenome]